MPADGKKTPTPPTELPGQTAERIDAFIASRLRAMAAALPPSTDAPGDALVAEVRFLATLARARDVPRLHTRRRRGWLFWLVLLTAATVTVLVFVRLRRVQIELAVRTSAVSFRAGEAAGVIGALPLSLLQVLSAAESEIATDAQAAPVALAPPLELRPVDAAASVILSPMTLPEGARLSIEQTSGTDSWRLAVSDQSATATVTLAGRVKLAASKTGASVVDFGRGRALTLQSRDDEAVQPKSVRLELDVVKKGDEPLRSIRPISLVEVSFDREVEEPASSGLGIVRAQMSGILEGEVFNVSLGSRRTSLRRHETLRVEGFEGWLRELQFGVDGVHADFVGSASDIQVGTIGSLRSLKPSLLEWLAEHHGLKLLWGAGAWLFALVAGGLRWWRNED